MVEANQPIDALERLTEWKLRFYYLHVREYLKHKAEAHQQAIAEAEAKKAAG